MEPWCVPSIQRLSRLATRCTPGMETWAGLFRDDWIILWCEYPCLYFFPLLHGHGPLRPTRSTRACLPLAPSLVSARGIINPLFSAARLRRAALLSFGHVGLGQCLHQGISQSQDLGVEFDNIGPGFSPTLVPPIPPLNLGTIGCGHIDVSPFTVFADHEDSGGM
jgi:hypothetical protein